MNGKVFVDASFVAVHHVVKGETSLELHPRLWGLPPPKKKQYTYVCIVSRYEELAQQHVL